MKRVLVLCGLVVLGALASHASGADRTPIVMSGLTPDDWGQAINHADATAHERWPGYARAWCRGIIIAGNRSRSSFVDGTTRYWDKTFCVALPRRNSYRGSSFVLDAKKGGVKMYRVHPYQLPGTTGAGPKPPPSPKPPPRPKPKSNCNPNYRGYCVPNVPYDLDCSDIPVPVVVVGVDVYGFDADGDGIGCEDN